MKEWGLYCNELKRELVFPEGINNYIEKYLIIEGDLEDGIYSYNFNIEKIINYQPSGSMNMAKFTNVAFEFETIDPWREMIPNEKDSVGALDIDLDCHNYKKKNYIEEAWGENIDKFFDHRSPGGPIISVNDRNYTDFDYNYNLHIMEERYNIIEFSGGMGKLLFAR
jgi:hypothetical protein